MEPIFHSETCDGEKHWILCSKPITWESCNDFRYCNKNCKIYTQSNKINCQRENSENNVTKAVDSSKFSACGMQQKYNG